MDAEGMTHSVRVAAGSVYEAAALGLAEFRKCAMMDAGRQAPRHGSAWW